MDVEQVAEELYGLPPREFTAARDALALEARHAGDSETARTISRLRKPTVVAWLANQLVRQRRPDVEAFLEIGPALREATATLSGPRLRELSEQRHRLVQALTQQARQLAREAGQPVTEDMSRGLEETLAAALADEESGERLREGRLTEALQPTGFDLSAGLATAGPAPKKADARPARRDSNATSERSRRGLSVVRPPAPAPAKPAVSAESAEERRRAARAARLERELAEATSAAEAAAAQREEAGAAAKAAAEEQAHAAQRVDALRHELAEAKRDLEEAETRLVKARNALAAADREADRAAGRVDRLRGQLEGG